MRLLATILVALTLFSVTSASSKSKKKALGKSCTKNKHCVTSFCDRKPDKKKGHCSKKRGLNETCYMGMGFCKDGFFCKRLDMNAKHTAHPKGKCIGSKKRKHKHHHHKHPHVKGMPTGGIGQAPVPGQFVGRPPVPVPGQFAAQPQAPVSGQFVRQQQAPTPGQFVGRPPVPVPGQFIGQQQAPVPGQFAAQPQAPTPGQFVGQPQGIPQQLAPAPMPEGQQPPAAPTPETTTPPPETTTPPPEATAQQESTPAAEPNAPPVPEPGAPEAPAPGDGGGEPPLTPDAQADIKEEEQDQKTEAQVENAPDTAEDKAVADATN